MCGAGAAGQCPWNHAQLSVSGDYRSRHHQGSQPMPRLGGTQEDTDAKHQSGEISLDRRTLCLRRVINEWTERVSNERDVPGRAGRNWAPQRQAVNLGPGRDWANGTAWGGAEPFPNSSFWDERGSLLAGELVKTHKSSGSGSAPLTWHPSVS